MDLAGAGWWAWGSGNLLCWKVEELGSAQGLRCCLLHLWACEGSCADGECSPGREQPSPRHCSLLKQGYLALAERSRAKAQGYHSALQGSLPSVQALLQSLEGHAEHNGAVLQQHGSDLRNKLGSHSLQLWVPETLFSLHPHPAGCCWKRISGPEILSLGSASLA